MNQNVVRNGVKPQDLPTQWSTNPCFQDALERLESLDRRFEVRSRSAADRNGSVAATKG